MDTVTIDRPRLDLDRIIAEAPKEPEPQTIAEIYAELGSLPFRVRKVRPTNLDTTIVVIPGEEREIIEQDGPGWWITASSNTNESEHLLDSRSWILLGAK